MISLRNLLSDLYPDRTEAELEELLIKLDLLIPLKNTITSLNALISIEGRLINELKALPVGHVVAHLLYSVNSRIQKEKQANTKSEIENLLSDICIEILSTFLENLKSDTKIAIAHIDYSLKDTCNFYGYDYHQLFKFLKLDSRISYHQSIRSAERIENISVPSLLWKGEPQKKVEFIELFTDHKLAISKKGLFNLFEKPTYALNLQFNPALATLTLQFFYTVKKERLVTRTGGKGFYQTLAYHILDFDKIFLNNQEAKFRINSLRQSKAQWNENQLHIDKWLKPFLPTKT